jgi:uncharacterized protein YggT (Ycf19 family)
MRNFFIMVERVIEREEVVRPMSPAARIVSIITGLVLTLLGLRFVFSLLGANQDNPIAQFVYGVTGPLVAPFFGLFGYNFQVGIARFEFETLVAMAIYALVGYFVAHLLAATRA